MAGQLKMTTTIEDTDPFSSIEPLKKTFTVAYTNKVEQVHALSDTLPVTAWDPQSTTSPATIFAALMMLSDGTCYAELGINTDDAGTDAAQFNSFTLSPGLPFMLGADDAYGDHTTGAALAGTLDTIDKIRLVNPTASSTVNVKIILVT